MPVQEFEKKLMNAIATSLDTGVIRIMPTMLSNREFVAAGGLMSYGPSFSDLFRRAGDSVDKILHGAKPGDIPVEQPIKFHLVINWQSASMCRRRCSVVPTR